MASQFFVSKKTIKKLQKDVLKREKIENEIKELKANIKNDVSDFYKEIDDDFVKTIIDFEKDDTNENKQTYLTELYDRFINNKISPEDALSIIDSYEKMMKYSKENDNSGE